MLTSLSNLFKKNYAINIFPNDNYNILNDLLDRCFFELFEKTSLPLPVTTGVNRCGVKDVAHRFEQEGTISNTHVVCLFSYTDRFREGMNGKRRKPKADNDNKRPIIDYIRKNVLEIE